ncbi:MAG: hypothetical protein HY298_06535 [Verrucomicrobia bacterium]|nr:hypothetical protein [Verrucomicrobiota bacterium]
MKNSAITKASTIATMAFALLSLNPGKTFAHCDGMDGPVVKAAQKALADGNVNPVLIWVQKDDEAEIKCAFEQTLAVRKLNADAKQLADRFFFETLVRIHRAGEGAPYTGLKPAGRDLGPAIPAADQALKDGNIQPIMKLLTETVHKGVERHFNDALKKKNFAQNDVEAGREFVKAYVEYIHCVEALYKQASRQVHGHFPQSGEGVHDHEE